MANPGSSHTPESGDEANGLVPRRTVLKGAALAIGAAAVAPLLAACGASATAAPASSAAAAATTPPQTAAGGQSAPPPPPSPMGTVTLGSNHSDAVPKAALQDVVNAFQQQTGIQVAVNTVDTTKFQDQISSYLQGTPQDVFTWFAGARMRFFAAQGLSTPIDDVWAAIASDYTVAFQTASKGDDGHYYFIPFANYPWAVFYRPSVFQAHGYTVPTTFTQLKALGDQMKKDGLAPMAFGDKDGWPAMGYFDILNLRQNGYQFHVDLMAGKEKWTDPRVKTVFQTWAELMPYLQQGGLGRTFEDIGVSLLQKKAGMDYTGMFVAQQFTNPADLADLDFFPFPTLGTPFDAEAAIEAPIDGFMLSKAPKNLAGAKALLEFLAKGSTQTLYHKSESSDISTASDADTSIYTPLQKRAQSIIASSTRITQFMDRDTRADFAGANGMQAFLQTFLSNPSQNLDPFLGKIQSFYDSLGPLS